MLGRGEVRRQRSSLPIAGGILPILFVALLASGLVTAQETGNRGQPFVAPQYLVHATGHGTTGGPVKDDWYFLFPREPQNGTLELPDGWGGTFTYSIDRYEGPFTTPKEVCEAAYRMGAGNAVFRAWNSNKSFDCAGSRGTGVLTKVGAWWRARTTTQKVVIVAVSLVLAWWLWGAVTAGATAGLSAMAAAAPGWLTALAGDFATTWAAGAAEGVINVAVQAAARALWNGCQSFLLQRAGQAAATVTAEVTASLMLELLNVKLVEQGLRAWTMPELQAVLRSLGVIR